jgi:hypothetical protein
MRDPSTMTEGWGSIFLQSVYLKTKTPWSLVRERTIPTERPPLVEEILVSTFVDRGDVAWSVRRIPYGR